MTDDELDDIKERKREQLMEETTGSAAPTEPVHVDDGEHLAEIVATHDVVLVDYFAEWCGPCKMMEPALETVADETDAVVAKVDVDDHQGLAAEEGVQGVPTLVVYADGEAVDRSVGAQDEASLRETVSAYS